MSNKLMTQKNRETVEARELEFYASFYKNEAYNLLGKRLCLTRELSSLKLLSRKSKLKNVLSIGCGNGLFEMMLAPYAENITAIDISPEAIKSAKEKQDLTEFKNISFRCESFADMNWNEKFDTIICLAFLHHVQEKDLPNFLESIYKHLNPSGFFYSQDPNIHGILRKIGRIVLGNNYDKYHTPDERELDPQELKSLLEKTGFNSIQIHNLDLTLIPAIYMFTKGYNWLMYTSVVIDQLWSKSLFAPWASGFAMISYKKI